MKVLAVAAALVGGAIGALGGLVLYWTIAARVAFRRHGYRVRQLAPREFMRRTPGPKAHVYEELGADGTLRALPFVRVVTRRGYPVSSVVYLPAESDWEAQVPAWAHGRRAEILERIARLLGASV